MTTTTAEAILTLARHVGELTDDIIRDLLSALLPLTSAHNPVRVQVGYDNAVAALYNRDRYDESGVLFAAVMLDDGTVLGDLSAYQVSEDGSIGLDPALAVEPEREAWDVRAREIAEKMAANEVDAELALAVAETVQR